MDSFVCLFCPVAGLCFFFFSRKQLRYMGASLTKQQGQELHSGSILSSNVHSGLGKG